MRTFVRLSHNKITYPLNVNGFERTLLRVNVYYRYYTCVCQDANKIKPDMLGTGVRDEHEEKKENTCTYEERRCHGHTVDL